MNLNLYYGYCFKFLVDMATKKKKKSTKEKRILKFRRFKAILKPIFEHGGRGFYDVGLSIFVG